MFLGLVINTHTSAEVKKKKKKASFHRDILSNLNAKLVKYCSVCVVVWFFHFFLFFFLNLATYNTPFSSESHSLEQMEEGYILPQVGRYLGKQLAFLKHAVLYKIL